MSEAQSTPRNTQKYKTEEERTAAIRETKRRWEKKNRDRGLCKCGRPRSYLDLKLCMMCQKSNKLRCKKNGVELRRKRSQLGLCMTCGKCPPATGRKRCAKCLETIKASVKRKREKWKENGQCIRCGGESNWEKHCPKCRARQVAFMRQYRHRVFDAYGGYKCACCGETEYEFLTIDHVNNDGAQHRSRVGSRGIYRDIVKQGFPAGPYQVLCMNCNWGKRRHGVCPHQLKCESVSDPGEQDAVGDA